MKVRTRVAPSPTGDPHLGTAYVALFNWVFAKKHGGSFILRIEDTDQVRSTTGSELAILDSLKWLGLGWDEGPDCGGDFGPYRQSERKNIYQQYANELVENGKAFHCFCSAERLNQVRADQRARKETTRYDGHCLSLTESEVKEKKQKGESSVIRLVVPEEGESSFIDRLRGEISIPYQQIDMQVLIKADGMPTYHLAHVIDDKLMDVTHVIRGEEWISSTPRHVLIHDALKWNLPKYVHVPLILGKDKAKLSKRHGAESALEYKARGYLPEAILNFLALLGWSPGDNTEIMTLDEFLSKFTINRILGHPAVFDPEKLEWMNGSYIRNLDDEYLSKQILNEVNKDLSDGGLISEKVDCLLYTSPSPRDRTRSRMPSSA